MCFIILFSWLCNIVCFTSLSISNVEIFCFITSRPCTTRPGTVWTCWLDPWAFRPWFIRQGTFRIRIIWYQTVRKQDVYDPNSFGPRTVSILRRKLLLFKIFYYIFVFVVSGVGPSHNSVISNAPAGLLLSVGFCQVTAQSSALLQLASCSIKILNLIQCLSLSHK